MAGTAFSCLELDSQLFSDVTFRHRCGNRIMAMQNQ
jgi:hypothetical protein